MKSVVEGMLRRCLRSGSRASQQQQVVHMQPVTTVHEVVGPLEPLEIAGEDGVSTTWQPDPNEPRYCLCNDVSYGDMVACDNEDVSDNCSHVHVWLSDKMCFLSCVHTQSYIEHHDICVTVTSVCPSIRL